MFILTVSPVALASGNSTTIKIDYPTFITNEEYYTNLSKEGYTIEIFIGDEYAEEEQARLDSMKETPSSDITPFAAPSSGWNLVAYGRYTGSGYGDVMSKYVFWGRKDITFYCYNSVGGSFKVRVFDPLISNTSPSEEITVPGGTAILRTVTCTTPISGAYFYFLASGKQFDYYCE